MTIDEPRNTGCRSQKSFLPMDDESQTIVIPRHSKILFKSFDNNNFAKKLFHPPTGLCNVQKWTESGGNSGSLSLSLSFSLSLLQTQNLFLCFFVVGCLHKIRFFTSMSMSVIFVTYLVVYLLLLFSFWVSLFTKCFLPEIYLMYKIKFINRFCVSLFGYFFISS